LYPKHKKVIFVKITHFDDFPFSVGNKPEADLPQHQEQGRVLSHGVACLSAFPPLLSFSLLIIPILFS
jgi:hypothetical protein